MVKNGQNWIKIYENGYKQVEMDQNSQNGSNGQNGQNSQKQPKMAKNAYKRSELPKTTKTI